jgi:hypothetical protein
VIGHLSPIKPVKGFGLKVSLKDIQDAYEKRVVSRVINAGSTLQAVTPDETAAGLFYTSPDLYEALLMLSASTPRSAMYASERDRFYAELEGAQTRGLGYGGNLSEPSPRVAGPAEMPRISGPNAAPVSPSDIPAFLAGNVPVQTPEAVASDQERLDQFVASFLNVLRIVPEQYFDMSGPAIGAAEAVSAEFARVRSVNRPLDHKLMLRDEQERVAVDNARFGLGRGLRADDASGQRLLESAFQEVQQSWDKLMLLPGGPYERVLLELIQALEPQAAEGRLGQQDLALLDAAKALRAALTATPRQSETDWQQINHLLAQWLPVAPKVGNGNQSLM